MMNSYEELRNHFPYLTPNQPPPLLSVQTPRQAPFLQQNYHQVLTRVYGITGESRQPQTYPAYVTRPPNPLTARMRNAVSVRISETSAFETIKVARSSSSTLNASTCKGPHDQMSPKCSCDTLVDREDQGPFTNFKESSVNYYNHEWLFRASFLTLNRILRISGDWKIKAYNIILINLNFETIFIKKINAKRLARRFDIVEMSLSSERINYKSHISKKIVE